MLVRLLCLVLIALLALPMDWSSESAEAGKRRKTVTRSFSSSGQVAIPGNGTATPYPSTLQVSGFRKGKIKDVNVTLRDFSHDRPDHVDILLVSPDGRNTLILSDVGGSDRADNLTIVLDDQAFAALPLTSQLTSGTFRPTSDGPIDTLPAPAPLGRLRGEYRAQMLIKGTNRKRMREALTSVFAERPDLARRTVVDVDPVSVL